MTRRRRIEGIGVETNDSSNERLFIIIQVSKCQVDSLKNVNPPTPVSRFSVNYYIIIKILSHSKPIDGDHGDSQQRDADVPVLNQRENF